MDRKNHWQQVYTTKLENAVSWFQQAPTVSVRLMDAVGLSGDT